MKRPKLLVGQDGQNDSREQQELGESENFSWRGAAGEFFQTCLEFQQEQAGHAQGSGNPKVLVVNQRAHQVSRQTRHLGRDARSFGSREFVPIGQRQKAANHQEAERQGQQLRAGQKSD